MAFAPGVRARVKLAGLGLFSGSVNPQPPLVGVVQSYAAPVVVVLMEDGRLLTTDDTFLDEITATLPTSFVNTLLDKVVVGIAAPAAPPLAAVLYSDEYIGRVVDVYSVGGTPKALVCSLSNGMFYELAALTDVFVLEDR
jgi:hypothetical protein